MDNMEFYEYVFTILSEAGHVITSSPIYVNHSSGETLYIDSSKDVVTNRFERDLLSLIDNVSLLVDVRWPGVVPELDENVQIYSATVDFSERCRSQNIADIHHLLQKYWNCTHSIVFFKNRESYLISFADKDRSHILSDWFSITYEWDKIVERVGIENIAIDTCENYFLDFIYATAREYYIRPISFEEASYGLMPLDYISKSLSSDIPLSRDEIKNMIRDNLLFFELMYGDDYVEPQYTGMEERTYYHNISDEIDRISFELELEDTDDEEQFSFEYDLDDDDKLCEELGDLLLQVGMLSCIAADQSRFTLRDVTTGLCAKLIYRHPHVFGDAVAADSAAVLKSWEQLKKAEKHQQTQGDVLRAVPRPLPALTRSAKVQKKAAQVGFDWDDALGALPKIHEEADEVRAELEAGRDPGEELGDLLFSVVNVIRLAHGDAEGLMQKASDKFIRRFEAMENLIISDGKSLEDLTLGEMDVYWNRVKQRQASGAVCDLAHQPGDAVEPSFSSAKCADNNKEELLHEQD